MSSGPVLALLERWRPRAHDSMAVLGDTPESVVGKPWDRADYIRIFRVEEGRVFLEVDTSERRMSGVLHGLTGARAQAHPWGSALVLQGPLRWVGTQTIKATGLAKLAAGLVPSLGAAQTRAYDAEWSQITLVLPCAWTP